MKKILPLFLLITSFIGLNELHAQCVPDDSIAQPGFYPDSLQHAAVGQAYSNALQLKVPLDTMIDGFSTSVDSIVLINVSGLPPNFNYESNPSSNSFPGGSNACILFTGPAPTKGMVGSYPFTIYTTIYGKVLGVPASIPDSVFTYGIQIDSASITPSCAANFSIFPDTTQLHHYIVINNSTGIAPIAFYWSWGDGNHDTIPYPTHTYADSGFYEICLSITDSTGCQSTFCDTSFHAMRTTNTMVFMTVVEPSILGTREVSLETEVILYPNPAGNQLTIQTSIYNKSATISIINVMGQEEGSYSLSGVSPDNIGREGGAEALDIRRLAAGMYFLQLKTESGSVVKKFVKE